MSTILDNNYRSLAVRTEFADDADRKQYEAQEETFRVDGVAVVVNDLKTGEQYFLDPDAPFAEFIRKHPDQASRAFVSN